MKTLDYWKQLEEGVAPSTAYLSYLVSSEEENPVLQYNLRTGFENVYFELAKLELDRRGIWLSNPVRRNYEASLYRVNERIDCGDFVIPGFLTILLEYADSPLLDPEIRKEMEQAILNYKYWIDEPGQEANHTCFFTENHQSLFHSIEYLAGDLFPDRIFTNNQKSGAWHKEHGFTYLKRWLTWRKRFGFSEWLSNTYYAVDLLSMGLLSRYAPDQEIKNRARMLLDLLLFDITLHSYQGNFCATSGRMYNAQTMNPAFAGTNAVYALLFQKGYEDGGLLPPAVLLACFDYQPAAVLREIANDCPDRLEIRQRMSFNVEDSGKYGIDPSDFDNIMLYWSMHTFHHRLVIENSRKLCPDWYNMDASIAANLEKFQMCERMGILTDPDPNISALTQADIYTYRTPNYMLSCAQDYRRGRTNFQQHIWQATLGGKAVVFTTHPGSADYTGRPNYFVGNGNMPKAVAYKNVALILYRIPAESAHDYCTHCYFPVHEFDEFVEENGWFFGRKKNGYIALRSVKKGGSWRPSDPALFQSIYHDTWEEEWKKASKYDFWVAGHANVWICEMGEPETHGTFAQFREKIGRAKFSGDPFSFTYESPSVGILQTGWTEPFLVNGKEIPLHGYPRYETPYCHADFDTNRYEISCHGKKLVLDFERNERTES